MQDYPGVQVGANTHVSEYIVILSRSYSEVQGLFEAVYRHTAAVDQGDVSTHPW